MMMKVIFHLFHKLVGWLLGFYGMSTLVGLFEAKYVFVLFVLYGVWLLLMQLFVYHIYTSDSN